MSEQHKATLEKANLAITQGEYENFLVHCTDDTEWTFVGDRTLKGKEAVRQYMAEVYKEPPKFSVSTLIAEGDYVNALGEITLDGVDYSYCDVWRFRNGKMAELRAFVIKTNQ